MPFSCVVQGCGKRDETPRTALASSPPWSQDNMRVNQNSRKVSLAKNALKFPNPLDGSVWGLERFCLLLQRQDLKLD